MWNKIIKKHDEIIKKFKENDFMIEMLIWNRIEKGHLIPPNSIMT